MYLKIWSENWVRNWVCMYVDWIYCGEYGNLIKSCKEIGEINSCKKLNKIQIIYRYILVAVVEILISFERVFCSIH